MTGLRLDIGVHDISAEDYFADPCIEPSLNASLTRVLIEKTPAHFQIAHPRLAPPSPPDEDEDEEARRETKEQRMGSIIHLLGLGKGKRIEVCDFPNWKKDAAKQARADAAATGALAVLPKELARGERIWMAARPQLERKFGAWPIGDAEQTLIWRRQTKHGSIYCRAMVDMWSDDRTVIVDLKSTGKPLDDESLAGKIAADGGEVQDAHYTDGVQTLHPHLAGRIEFWFAFIEVNPPFLVRRKRLPESLLHLSRRDIARASDAFAKGLKTGAWPGWRETSETIDPKGWHLAKLETRDLIAGMGEDA